MMAIALVVLAACGIDESGLVPLDGGGANDAFFGPEGGADVAPDVPLPPPSCATTDLSCLGFDAGAPDGWTPYVLAVGDAGCPAGDYVGTPWVTNPSVAAGSCACNCTSQGTWSCPSTINASNGIGCNSSLTANNGQCQSQTAQHIEVAPVAATNNGVGCSADASAPVAQSEPASLCSAGCDAGAAGICGQPAGTRCIATDGVVACPTGFTQHVLGASASASCAACTCSTGAAPTCTATATVYYGYGNFPNYTPDSNCQTGGQFTTQQIGLDGTCQQAKQIYDSFAVSWGPVATPSCTPAGGGGDAGLSSPKTLCCQ